VKKLVAALSAAWLLAGCASTPSVTTILPLDDSADAPYGNVLVVSLFESFDQRRYLENAIVRELKSRGVDAVASTTRMDTRTPVNRDTFVAMVEEVNADALLLTQLVDLEVRGKLQNMRPEATYNIRETWYYNVWSVELTEYTEPQSVKFSNTVLLSAQMFSASSRQPVWAIETEAQFVQDFDDQLGEKPYIDEAVAIVRALAGDGALDR